MAVPDFDTSRNRECMECYRAGFDEGDWQFMGMSDDRELYICPDCQSLAIRDDDELQTRVAEQRDEAVESIRKACPAWQHEFLRDKAGHDFCYRCGERLHS